MPQGEHFWNPYRWVTVCSQPVEHAAPRYYHALNGLSGRISCELEALTPLIIGNGHGEFTRSCGTRLPYIPATSLKGALRSLAEVVGNTEGPFANQTVGRQHGLDKAAASPRLDTVARTFGYLRGKSVFAGLIRFSDAALESRFETWPQYKIAVGQPKGKHRAFYLGPAYNQRKFYHHHPGARQLVCPHSGITQTIPLRPAPPGTRFSFTVDFVNLRDAELNLLLYCLALEEQVAVTLSPAALGRADGRAPVTLQGPLRHKIGGAKPHGAGSVHVRITKMALRPDAAARYRGHDSTKTWEGGVLMDELVRRTASFRGRSDVTMRELRAMLIYTTEDPRKPIQYPTFQWFRNGENANTPLKPTR